MKLVRERGGEAIADTSWSILTESGDIVRESVGAFASMVLAEGNYAVVAKNRDRSTSASSPSWPAATGRRGDGQPRPRTSGREIASRATPAPACRILRIARAACMGAQ
jgi:hypothetical protein